MNLKSILLGFCCCLSLISFAQEQLGLRTENYSGINSVLLNPANNLTTPFQWDLNLVAGGQFIDNNFGGFRNTSLGKLLNAREDQVFLATDYPSDQQFPNGAIIFDFEETGKNKFASITTQIMGPSFMLNFEKHSFGVFTNFRAAIGGQKIPAVLGYYDYKQILPNNDYNIFKSQIAGMAWSEVGFNYLFKTETTNGQIGIGFNLKYLQGFESFFLKNNGNLNITKLDRDALDFNNGANIDFGFTTSSLDAEDVDLQKSGTGFGGDFGITYASTDYQDGTGFKIGLSIIDIGKIAFDTRTEAHKIDIDDSFFFDPRNLEDVTDFREGLAQLNQELFSNDTTSFVGTSYEIGLPTAFSLQGDVAIQENIYVNATLIQQIPNSRINVERGNLFALTPRYESRWISAFIPVSVYNWQHVRVGTAIRLGFLTIGSDDLGSLFGKKNLTGTDFYAALKINPFRLGWKDGGSGKGKAMKCYEF